MNPNQFPKGFLKSFLANYSKKKCKKVKIVSPSYYPFRKMARFNLASHDSKVNLHHLRKISTGFNRNWVLKINMLNWFNDIIFCSKVINLRPGFFEKIFSKIIWNRLLRLLLYLNVTNIETLFHALNLT